MNIPQKIMDMISIIILTIQAIVYWVYNKLQETIIRIPNAATAAANAAATCCCRRSKCYASPMGR